MKGLLSLRSFSSLSASWKLFQSYSNVKHTPIENTVLDFFLDTNLLIKFSQPNHYPLLHKALLQHPGYVFVTEAVKYAVRCCHFPENPFFRFSSSSINVALRTQKRIRDWKPTPSFCTSISNTKGGTSPIQVEERRSKCMY